MSRFRFPAAAAAAVLVGSLTVVSASAQVTSLPLPAPPVATNATASLIFDAMLAIARTAASNPAQAQQATFSYHAAIQQYNAGDYQRARSSAVQAIAQTNAAPLPQPTDIAPSIPQQQYVTMPQANGVNASDAEEYLALARRSLGTSCVASIGGSPDPALMSQFSTAVAANASKAYAKTVTLATAVVNACATAQQQLTAQQNAAADAQAKAKSTPIPLATYAAQPAATLIPDPALAQGTPTPLPMPSATAAPQRRGFHLFS